MTAIINATLVMRDHLIPNGVLLMENGKITAFGESRKMEIPEGCEIIDLKYRETGYDTDFDCVCGRFGRGIDCGYFAGSDLLFLWC